MVTGITPQECNEKGIPEPEFAAKILDEFSQPNTCVMGYNNIRYDDEMTRYTFYRNFIDPYEYSWKKWQFSLGFTGFGTSLLCFASRRDKLGL